MPRSNFINSLKAMLPFWGIILAGFYLLPAFINNTGSGMLIILIALPLICFASAFFYGIKQGFNIAYSIVVALLFIPSLFIFYNVTAWVYIIAYAVLSLIGNLIGTIFYKQTN